MKRSTASGRDCQQAKEPTHSWHRLHIWRRHIHERHAVRVTKSTWKWMRILWIDHHLLQASLCWGNHKPLHGNWGIDLPDLTKHIWQPRPGPCLLARRPWRRHVTISVYVGASGRVWRDHHENRLQHLILASYSTTAGKIDCDVGKVDWKRETARL